MKTITINEKEYTLEYTIEASLYSECVEKTITLMTNIFSSAESEDLTKIISAMTDIPQTTITMFYAGLLENHSEEIKSVKDAKNLIKVLMKENKDDEILSNFYGIMQYLMECMSDDGFFKQIGLEQMMSSEEVQTEIQQIPQDHKKKHTTKKTNPGEK